MTPTQQNERFFSLLESPVMNGNDKLALISLFLSMGEKEQGEFLEIVEAYKDEEEEMRNILRERFEFIHRSHRYFNRPCRSAFQGNFIPRRGDLEFYAE